jgi:ATP-dependent helicase HrpA
MTASCSPEPRTIARTFITAIIVDEAPASLNIDTLLGYLGPVARRADLKLVITSATLDAERFARHFGSAERPAPVIDVSGRLYPVDVRYRPLARGDGESDDEEELEEAIVSAVEETWREGSGDILVFLPGEREIRETGELLRRGLARRPYAAALEILPLYARLSINEQQRIFARRTAGGWYWRPTSPRRRSPCRASVT